MKKLHLFCGSQYYPNNGLGDYIDSYETEVELQVAVQLYSKEYDWWVVIGQYETGRLYVKESGVKHDNRYEPF